MKDRIFVAFAGLFALFFARLYPLSGQDAAAPAKEEPRAPALPEIPQTLEEMLAIALRSNPEILKAEAKVRKAEADLNQARLRVTQEVISGYHELLKEKGTQDALAAQEEHIRKLMAVGQAPSDATSEILVSRLNAKARAAQNEAQLRYKLGLGGSLGRGAAGTLPAERREAARRPELSKELKQVLAKEVSVNFDDGKPLREIIEKLKELSGGQLFPMIDQIPGFSRRDVSTRSTILDQQVFSFSFSRVPLRVLLLALADRYQVCFVFREYGLLVTTPERASTMSSPAIPEETPLKLE
jgi:hypothetical protein